MRSQLSQGPKNFALRSEPIGAQRPFAWQPIVAAIVPINCYRTAKGTTSLKCRDNALSWERLDGFVMGERLSLPMVMTTK